MVVRTCNPTVQRLKQEDCHEVWASLGYRVRPSQRLRKKNSNQESSLSPRRCRRGDASPSSVPAVYGTAAPWDRTDAWRVLFLTKGMDDGVDSHKNSRYPVSVLTCLRSFRTAFFSAEKPNAGDAGSSCHKETAEDTEKGDWLIRILHDVSTLICVQALWGDVPVCLTQGLPGSSGDGVSLGHKCKVFYVPLNTNSTYCISSQ